MGLAMLKRELPLVAALSRCMDMQVFGSTRRQLDGAMQRVSERVQVVRFVKQI